MFINPCQVLRKAEGAVEAEGATAVVTGKPKEAAARARCWKGSLLWGLQGTGETRNSLFMGIIAANPNVTFLLQNCSSCLASPFLLWGSTQASPFTSTSRMFDFFPDQK